MAETPDGLMRLFPRGTRGTPDDPGAFVGDPPLWVGPAGVAEIHVSCTFTWDKPETEALAQRMRFRFPDALVKVGGPAYGDPGAEFEPGRYLRRGYVITSRGCPNVCRYCLVPQREGPLRTIPIRDGWNVQDNNLLACPEAHIAAVLTMLRRQRYRPRFSGGLEAARFWGELAREIVAVRPERIFFAYDHPGQFAEVERAIALAHALTGWRRNALKKHMGCYILVGQPGDVRAEAEERIKRVIKLGVRAFPMLFRAETGEQFSAEWKDLVGAVISMGGFA